MTTTLDRPGSSPVLPDRRDPGRRAVFDAHRHRRRAGVVQVVSVEVAAVAVAAGLYAGRIAAAVAGVFALCLLAMVFGRSNGRWWYESVGARWRLRRRRSATHPPSEPRLAALSTATSGLAVRAVVNQHREIGVGRDESGWFAAVLLEPRQDISGTHPVHLRLDRLVGILTESSVPMTALQLIVHRTGAPSLLLDPGSAAARSYRDLVAQSGAPLEQAVWLALRLSPDDAAEAARGRGGGVEGVDRAVAAGVGRIVNVLGSAGVPHRVLDAEGLRDALAYSCGLDSMGTGPVREQWSTWQTGDLAHVTFDVRRWPGDPAPDLLGRLAAVAASEVTATLVVRPHADRVALLGLVRVLAPAPAVRSVVDELHKTAKSLGVRLRRLHGDQARAAYATAPTGGGGL